MRSRGRLNEAGSIGPARGPTEVALDEISVGNALPGRGGHGEPIQGLGRSNTQMKGTLDAFAATLNATNTLHAGFEAGNAARTAGQRSQIAAQARRVTMFAAPLSRTPHRPALRPARDRRRQPDRASAACSCGAAASRAPLPGSAPGSIPSRTAETAMQRGGTSFDPTPLAEQSAPLLPAGFAAPPTTAAPLTRAEPGPDSAAEPPPGPTRPRPSPAWRGSPRSHRAAWIRGRASPPRRRWA